MSKFTDVLQNKETPLNGVPFEDVVNDFLGIDTKGKRDITNTNIPAIAKLLAHLATGQNMELMVKNPASPSGGMPYSDLSTRYAIQYGPSGSTYAEFIYTAGGDAKAYSPMGKDSWYSAGLVLPMIASRADWLEAWQTIWKEEVTDQGFDNLAQATWDRFHDLIQVALSTCRYVDRTTANGPTCMVDYAIAVHAYHHGQDLDGQDLITLSHWSRSGPELGEMNPAHFSPWTWEKIDIRTLVPVFADESASIVNMASALPSTEARCGGYIGIEGPLLMSFFKGGFHTALLGPTGCGKNLAVGGAMAEIGKDYVMYSGTESTTDEQLLGVNSMDVNGKIVWNDGPLTRAMREGKPLFIDEFNRIPIRMQNVVISTMAGEKCVFLNEKDGEQVFAEEGFFIIIAQNPDGAVHSSDKAVTNRFQRTLAFTYPETIEREVDIIMSQLPFADRAKVTIMVEVAHKTRELALTGEVQAPLSPRSIINWAECDYHMGGLLTESAEYTIMYELCGLQSDNHYNLENHTMVTEIINMLSKKGRS